MSNTYTKIYLHIVFAVKNRESLLTPIAQQRVHLYLAKMLNNAGHLPIAIGGVDNHVHILLDYKPTQPIPDMVRELKVAAAKMINAERLTPYSFAWQRGYGCFSYAPSQIEAVSRYIANQKEHHKRVTLREEMIATYTRFGIEFDERYVFDD